MLSPEHRCNAQSPIFKFDAGPHYCNKAKGHTGQHVAQEIDISYEARLSNPYRYWQDDDRGAIPHRDES
jgi:hypothetical protein